MQCGCEAEWDCPLISCFGDVALWVTFVGLRVIYLHEFGEARCEVNYSVLVGVRVVEPIISFLRNENG